MVESPCTSSPSIEAVDLPSDAAGRRLMPAASDQSAGMAAAAAEETQKYGEEAAASQGFDIADTETPTAMMDEAAREAADTRGCEAAVEQLSGDGAWLAAATGQQQYICASGLTICTQPAGYVTDYIVSAACLAFGVVLLTKSPREPSTAPVDASAFVIAFLLSSSVAALLGGLIHHVAHRIVRRVADASTGRPQSDTDAHLQLLWSTVLWCSSLPNFCMFATATWLVARSAFAATLVTGIGGAVYFAIACVVAYSRKIIIHIAASLPTIIYLLAASAYRHSQTSARWNIGATALLIVCGVITKAKIAISKETFNHNAVMHCVLLLANVCFFVGAYADLDAARSE